MPPTPHTLRPDRQQTHDRAAHRLAALRIALAQGLSQADIARTFGVSRQRIHQLITKAYASTGAND